jgi:hypothetical protein
MKPAVRAIVIITGCTLSLSAAVHATGGAERTVQEALYDFSDSFYTFACSENGELLPDTEGELIDLEGYLYERITYQTDAAGGVHFRLNTMPVGLRGAGVDSGEEFRIRESEFFVASQRLTGNVGSFRQEVKLTGRDTHRTYSLVSKGHYVIGADGTIKVSRESLERECR